jgi:hypothetical protein
MLTLSSCFTPKRANFGAPLLHFHPKSAHQRGKRSLTTTTSAAQDEGYPIESKLVSSTVGHGLFATKHIKEGDVVFSELPLISSQLVLSKEFVRACTTCQRFLNLHLKKVLPFFPTNVTPHLPRRYPQVYNYPHMEGSKHHFCSAECLDHTYMDFYQLIEGPPRASIAAELAQRKQRIDSEWCVALPTIPPDLVIKAICLEIKATNQKLRAFHHRSGNKPPFARTPKNRLKVLENFRPTKRSMIDIEPLCKSLAEYLTDLLLDFSPFAIDSSLVLDTIKRLLDYHQTIVLNVHEEKSIERYMASDDITSEDKKMLNESDKEIRVSGAGDIHLTWHPVASALYTAQSLINHSCTPNVFYQTITNHTHQLDVIAARSIAPGEQITASYLGTSLLTLPTMARKGHLASSFGFTCECPACSLPTKKPL